MPLRSKVKKNELCQDAFEVKASSIPQAGFGLFAKVAIGPGENIGYYQGKILTDDEVEETRYGNSLYLLWICKDHWIWGEGRYANYTRYINHSRKPNVELITSTRWKTARFEAIKPIAPGEEIYFDYGDYYWEQLEIDPVSL